MTHTITAIKARQNLGELLNRVLLKHDEFIIERGGRPMAAVIPVEKLEQIKTAARLHLGELLEKNRAANAGKSSPADEALANDAKRWARRRRAGGR